MGNLLLEVGPWAAHEGMGWWMLFGGTLWLIFWATVIYLAVSAFAHIRSRVRGLGAEPPQFAEQRYTSGEIGRDEFEQARRDPADTLVGIR